MKSYNVIIADTAADDLKDIIHHVKYTLSSPIAASHLFEEFKSSILSLSFFPERYPAYSDNYKHIKALPIGNYLILYAINEINTTVDIVRIVSSNNNVDKIISAVTSSILSEGVTGNIYSYY